MAPLFFSSHSREGLLIDKSRLERLEAEGKRLQAGVLEMDASLLAGMGITVGETVLVGNGDHVEVWGKGSWDKLCAGREDVLGVALGATPDRACPPSSEGRRPFAAPKRPCASDPWGYNTGRRGVAWCKPSRGELTVLCKCT